MKSESPKQRAEERQRRAATRTKIFLKAKGWMLTKTILVMVITSTGHARIGIEAVTPGTTLRRTQNQAAPTRIIAPNLISRTRKSLT
jgi:hypothetical protein